MIPRHIIPAALTLLAILSGCQSTYNASPAPAPVLAPEGTLVFVRPDRYSILGTRSIRDYVEIVYEESRRNEAGYLEVTVGFRNRGGQHFWDTKGPNYLIDVKTTFYTRPWSGPSETGAPVYETNWQTLTMIRGDTVHFKATAPVKSAAGYQITASERLTR